MPSTEVEIRSIPITLGGKKMYLRYNLNSHAYLRHYYGDVEKIFSKTSDDWDHDDVLHLLRAGLMDMYFDENEESIIRRDFDSIKPSIAGIGRLIDVESLENLVIQLVQALIDSFPKAPEGMEENFL